MSKGGTKSRCVFPLLCVEDALIQIVMKTATGCDSIGATYTHTNGNKGATRAGTASFPTTSPKTLTASYEAKAGISGGSLTTLPAAPVSGEMSIAVGAGDQISPGQRPG